MQHLASAGWLPTTASALPPFGLVQPGTVAEVLQALRSHERPVLLAGGTDLVAAFNEGVTPGTLVDLSKVEALRRIESTGQVLRIGSTVTHHDGSRDAAVCAACPGFATAWGQIANPRIRFTGTLGGNVMARRQRYEGAVLLSALDARLRGGSAEGDVNCSIAAFQHGGWPSASLLQSIDIDLSGLRWFDYERSMRPLTTLAACLRQHGDGLTLSVAIATEFLAPVLLRHPIATRGLPTDAKSLRDLAQGAMAGLPDTFHDPVLSVSYARHAGAALLARLLARVAA